MKFTQESVNLVHHISETMESHTFHHHYHILYDIRTLMGEKPLNYVEIGAFAGGSASLMSQHPFPTNCFSIDIGQPIPPEIAKRNVATFKTDNNTWEYIQGSSYNPNTVKLLKNKISTIDILFIDGDHSFNAVIKDFESYKNMVSPNGYVIFDDYHDHKHSPEVKTAVDYMSNNNYFKGFEVLGGGFKNTLKAYPAHKEYINEYIIKKL